MQDEPQKPKEDRRRVRTRKALIGAGQKLFAVKSIDGVTIDDIVEAADVAKGSFYNHFDDKENLADTIVELVQGDCEREVQIANADVTDARVRVARSMVTLIRYAKSHPDRYRALINLSKRRANIDAPINMGLRLEIGAGVESGQFTGISVEGGMLAVFGLIASTVEHLAATSPKRQPEEVAAEMAFMLLRALGVTNKMARSIADRASADLITPA